MRPEHAGQEFGEEQPGSFGSRARLHGHEPRKANRALVDALGEIAARKNATPAQLALAWVLAQKPCMIPIPGTTKLDRLKEDIVAVKIELTPDDFIKIDTASKIAVQGARYPDNLERVTGI